MHQLQAIKSKPSNQPARRDVQPLATPVSEHDKWMELQRGLGNQAVSRMLQRRTAGSATAAGASAKPGSTRLAKPQPTQQVRGAREAGTTGECEECRKKENLERQTKLRISEPGDIYEQEADRVAEQVLIKSTHPSVGGAPTRIQRFAGQPSGQMVAAPASVDRVLASPGRPLEPALRQVMEQRFDHDFSRVRVHVGAVAEQSARDVNANAYTVGHNMVFGAGRFAPGTQEGRRLIAHELTHVVQQRGLSPVSDFPPCGQDWQLHRQQIKSMGTVEHVGPAPSLGSVVGAVGVRTGEDVELSPGERIPNMIALTYAGALARDTRWLQFDWVEMTAFSSVDLLKMMDFKTLIRGPKVPGGFHAPSGDWQTFTTSPAKPQWYVDGGPTSPIYEEEGGASIRDDSSITMFDDPKGNAFAAQAEEVFTKNPDVSLVIVTTHFETYLIQRDVAIYRVSWSAGTAYTYAPLPFHVPFLGQGFTIDVTIGYSVDQASSGPVRGLPAHLKKRLDSRYPAWKHVK